MTHLNRRRSTRCLSFQDWKQINGQCSTEQCAGFCKCAKEHLKDGKSIPQCKCGTWLHYSTAAFCASQAGTICRGGWGCVMGAMHKNMQWSDAFEMVKYDCGLLQSPTPAFGSCSGSCWQADTNNYPSCSGYQSVGYTCVGTQCAACNPGGDPSSCATRAASGTAPNPATGTCQVPTPAPTTAPTPAPTPAEVNDTRSSANTSLIMRSARTHSQKSEFNDTRQTHNLLRAGSDQSMQGKASGDSEGQEWVTSQTSDALDGTLQNKCT